MDIKFEYLLASILMIIFGIIGWVRYFVSGCVYWEGMGTVCGEKVVIPLIIHTAILIGGLIVLYRNIRKTKVTKG